MRYVATLGSRLPIGLDGVACRERGQATVLSCGWVAARNVAMSVWLGAKRSYGRRMAGEESP